MNEVGKLKDKPGGLEKVLNEESAARTRPTSVEEIMQRRKRRESLENVKEETVGAAYLPSNDLAERAYDETEIGSDVLKEVSCEDRVGASSRNNEDAINLSREEKPMEEEFVGAAQLLGNDLVEKGSDYHTSEKGHSRSKKGRREERVKASSRKKEEASSSSREEKPMKEDPVGAIQLLGNDVVEKVSKDHASEKRNDRSKKRRHEERVREISRKKEDSVSSSREEKMMKEDPLRANQLRGNDIVEKVSKALVSEKGNDRSNSKKVRHEERVKDSSRKKEDTVSSSRGGNPMKEDAVGAAPLLGNDIVEKVSEDHASEIGNDRSKKVTHEESVKDSSRKKEGTTCSSREGKLMKEDVVGETQLLGNEIVEKVSKDHASEIGNDRSKKIRHEESVKDNSRKKGDTVSSSREEKLMKEDPVGLAQLLGDNIVERVSKDHASEKGNDRSKKVRHEESAKDRPRKKEDTASSFNEEKSVKEDLVGATQLLGHDIVENVSKDHVSELGNDRSRKVRHEERVKDSTIKKEDNVSSSKEEKPVGVAQLLEIDLVEKVLDCHASEITYDRSEKLRLEEPVKDSSRKKEDVISSSTEEKSTKENSVGAAKLLATNITEVSDCLVSDEVQDRSKKDWCEERVKESSRKTDDNIPSSREEKPVKEGPVRTPLVKKASDYHDSEKEYDRPEKLKSEGRVKGSSRRKEEAISSSREEKLDKPKQEEASGSNRRWKLAEEHVKDRRRNKGETNSTCREDRLDKKIKKEEIAANRKVRGESERPTTTETKTATYKDGLGVDTKMNAKRDRHATKTSVEQIHPQGTDREHGSRKRLRSLVVADVPRDEDSMKRGNENKIDNRNGDHKKNRERNMPKRQEPGKVQSVEVSDRWEKREQPKSHEHDTREKRKRSRSRDHGHDSRKKSSLVSKAEKAASGHKRKHEDRSENDIKDRSDHKRDHDEHTENAIKDRSGHKRDHAEHSENAVKDRPGKHQLKAESTVNNKSRRYGSSKSELGGYSPRKRREVDSAKAASPPNLSSDKRSAKWDLTPAVTASTLPGTNVSGLQSAPQTAYPTVNEASLTVLKPLMEVPFRMLPVRQITSVDSVQLTESTRSMRRLYAENVPESASDKSLIEWFNAYMLSSGSSHIRGSQPCISCMINKEKHQALVEFLTPQDASAALSFNGYSFEGSKLNIRRPKDYVETTSGVSEKKEPATNAVSDNVEDSPNKIFIGGFSKAISSGTLMEIVSVFGPLKAYRFVVNNDLNQQCAFLEYTDGSVTPKACAGLNGMKLGGSVITAVCALPDASSITVNENLPLYGIPEHAKPLLGKPKLILKLKNVVDPEDLSSLSEPELKEILEDVGLECSRFGVIKSLNIVEHESKDITKEMNMSVVQEKNEGSNKTDDIAEDNGDTGRQDSLTREEKLCEPCSDIAVDTNMQASEEHQSIGQDNETNVGESAENIQEVGSMRVMKTRWDTGIKMEEEEEDPEDVFEPGCIFIEYRRPEATRDAAYSLHGRLYENRIVKAEYVSKELYHLKFPSG